MFADQIKGDEICGACGWYRGEEKFIRYCGEIWRKRDNLENLDLDGSIIL
jgi:hypothetical protein